jgi:hypothetical protein
MNPLTPALPGLIALLASLLPEPAVRRRAIAGALLVALGLASLSLAGGPEWRAAGLPPSYLGIDAALILTGLIVPVVLTLFALRTRGWSTITRAAALVVAALLVVLGLTAVLPMARAGGQDTLTALAAFIAAAALIRYTAPRIAAGGRWLDALVFPVLRRPAPATTRRSKALLIISALCAVLALTVSRLDLLLFVVGIGATMGVLLEWELRRRWPIVTPLALIAFGAAAYLLIHVAADTPLTLRALTDAPYSEAFEILVALILGGVSWVLLGLWPFASAPRGPHAPVFAAALLVRVVLPILPDGATHWQPLFYLVPVLGAWHGALTGRVRESLRAIGTLGLLSPSEAAGWAGTGIVVCTLVADAAALFPTPQAEWRRSWRIAFGGTAIVGALLLLPVMDGALNAQIVYTVLTVCGTMMSLFGARAEEVALTSPPAAVILGPGHSGS